MSLLYEGNFASGKSNVGSFCSRATSVTVVWTIVPPLNNFVRFLFFLPEIDSSSVETSVSVIES